MDYNVNGPNPNGFDSRSSTCNCGVQSFVAGFSTVTTVSFPSGKGNGTATIAVILRDSSGREIARRQFDMPGNAWHPWTVDFDRTPVQIGASYQLELAALNDGMTIYYDASNPYGQGSGNLQGVGGDIDLSMSIAGAN